jgi:hypothetical protein
MIAYHKNWLDNLYIQEQAEEAVAHDCISGEEQAAIKERYTVRFYTPNFFIRVGLFLLTAIIACFALGLFTLMTIDASSSAVFGILLLFTAGLSYGALEYFVQQNNHYRSGVDDALLWFSLICFMSGANCFRELPELVNAGLLFVASLYLSLRYADTLMSAVACISALGVLFFAYLELGTIAKPTMPFVMMAGAAGIYFIGQWLAGMRNSKYYRHCLVVVKVVALLSFYVAGNYFVVREMSNELFGLQLKEGEGIPFGWVFWALTVGVPMGYMYRGVQKKDAVFLRVGLLLVAAMVFTIRYYHHMMPLEVAMIIGGAVLMGTAYFLIRYLRQSRNGFTYKEGYEPSPINKLQVEALVINQTFSTPQTAEPTGTQFGGGSGGGAGAGGGY